MTSRSIWPHVWALRQASLLGILWCGIGSADTITLPEPYNTDFETVVRTTVELATNAAWVVYDYNTYSNQYTQASNNIQNVIHELEYETGRPPNFSQGALTNELNTVLNAGCSPAATNAAVTWYQNEMGMMLWAQSALQDALHEMDNADAQVRQEYIITGVTLTGDLYPPGTGGGQCTCPDYTDLLTYMRTDLHNIHNWLNSWQSALVGAGRIVSGNNSISGANAMRTYYVGIWEAITNLQNTAESSANTNAMQEALDGLPTPQGIEDEQNEMYGTEIIDQISESSWSEMRVAYEEMGNSLKRLAGGETRAGRPSEDMLLIPGFQMESIIVGTTYWTPTGRIKKLLDVVHGISSTVWTLITCAVIVGMFRMYIRHGVNMARLVWSVACCSAAGGEAGWSNVIASIRAAWGEWANTVTHMMGGAFDDSVEESGPVARKADYD